LYLLFLDESGTHGGSPVLIVSGLAIHENDALHLQQKLESFLHNRISTPPLSLNAQEFELHATDIKNGTNGWGVVRYLERISLMKGMFQTLKLYDPVNEEYPLIFFGAAVDREKVPNRRAREQLAYELVLNKFDDMLGRVNRGHPLQKGLVIHDQRVVHGGRRVITEERAIQEWTRAWREVAGRVGRLHNFADIPLFADSQATRLIQAADFISYALWRSYGMGVRDNMWLNQIIGRFDSVNGVMHGLIHMSSDFARGSCTCIPCRNRLDRGLDPGTP